MATKPTAVFTFATDATFSSGPASGFATKIVPGSLAQGFVPGTGISAENVNYLMNIAGQWINDWLEDGSSLGAENAHLLETNSTGFVKIAAVEIQSTTTTRDSLVVKNPVGSARNAIAATGAVGDTAPIIDAIHAGPHHAIRGETAATTRSGVRGVNTSAAATVWGVTGELTNTSALNDGSAGVLGTGAGAAAGVKGIATNGYGVIAESDTTAPARAALRVVGQNAEPTVRTGGDIIYDTIEDKLKVDVNQGVAGMRQVWTTASGLLHAYDQSTGTSTDTSATFTMKCSVTINPEKSGSTLVLRAKGEIGCAVGADIEIRIRDVTNVVTVEGNYVVTVFHDTNLANERYFVIENQYTMPSAASTTFELQFRTTAATVNAHISKASLELTGDYND